MEILILLMNFIVLFGLFLFTSLTYRDLPKRIPIHFNLFGEVDRQARKHYYWLLPVIGLLIFILMTYEDNNLQHLTLRDFKITSHWQEGLISSFPYVINILILMLLIDIQSSIYKVATKKAERINKSFWLWVILLIVAAIVASTLVKT